MRSPATLSAARAIPSSGPTSGRLNVKSIAAQYSGEPCSSAPAPRPSDSSFACTTRSSGMNTLSSTIVLLPVPLSPTVSQSSTTSKSLALDQEPAPVAWRLVGAFRSIAAVSQLQWSTPLEKKPRPVQREPALHGLRHADRVDHG